jgi:nitrogen fixation/metabolism regulation signal transduction histidine kinase
MTTSAAPPPAAAAGGRPKYKRSIKNYMLEPKFQLKWTGYLLAVALIVSGLLGAFLLRTSNEVTEQSNQVISQGNKLLDESKKNSELVRMTIKEQYADAPELGQSFNKEADGIEKKLEEQHKQLEAQAATTKRQQQTMMMSLVGGLSFLVVLIGLVGIFITHKVVGPIYKMKLLLRQVGDGKLNFHGSPRKGDELRDLFEVFSATVEKLKARQAAEVDELTEAMAEAKATGASESALKKIEHVRDEMRAALEK